MTTTETRAAPPRLDHVFLDEEKRPHLGEIVIERGWLFPQDTARALAAEHGLEYADIQLSAVGTFDDELACLRERCESWTQPGRRAVVVEQAVAAFS